MFDGSVQPRKKFLTSLEVIVYVFNWPLLRLRCGQKEVSDHLTIRMSRSVAFLQSILLTCTCDGIHLGRVEPLIELTTSRIDALLTQRSCESSLETFAQSFLHRSWPKTRGPERGSRSALIMVAHVFSWPPVRQSEGRSRSLISSLSGRLA